MTKTKILKEKSILIRDEIIQYQYQDHHYICSIIAHFNNLINSKDISTQTTVFIVFNISFWNQSRTE